MASWLSFIPWFQPSKRKTVVRDEADGHLNPDGRFLRALDDAELLLKYAAEAGIDVDPTTRDQILAISARPHRVSGTSRQWLDFWQGSLLWPTYWAQ